MGLKNQKKLKTEMIILRKSIRCFIVYDYYNDPSCYSEDIVIFMFYTGPFICDDTDMNFGQLMIRRGYTMLMLVILLAGLYLRVSYAPSWLWFMEGYDESRDMLVARHIAEFGEHIVRGPFAAGGKDILINSPVYYYFIAGLWIITRSAEGVMNAWHVVMISIVILGYLTGCRIRDKLTGLSIAALLAFHPEIVQLSRFISQPHFIPVWTVLILYFISKRKFSPFQFVWGVSMVFAGAHLHLSAFLFIPVFTMVLLYRHWLAEKFRVSSILLSFLEVEIVVIVWAWITYREYLFDQMRVFSLLQRSGFGAVTGSVWESLSKVFELTTVGMHPLVAYILLFVGVISVIREFKRTNRGHIKLWYGMVIMLCLSAVVILGLYRSEVMHTYVLGVFTIVLCFIAFGIRELFSLNRWIGALVLMIISIQLTTHSVDRMRASPGISYYKQHEAIAGAIYDDFVFRTGLSADSEMTIDPDFIVVTLSDPPFFVYDAWGSGATWFWLEKYFGRPLVSIVPYGVNFMPRYLSPRMMYLVCDTRNGSSGVENCLLRFIKPRSYISIDPVIIYRTDMFKIWRFNIEDSTYTGGLYHVYTEFLREEE